jgi:hypothetical protein
VFLFTLYELRLSGVFGDGLIADAADRVVYPKLIDLVEEWADG